MPLIAGGRSFIKCPSFTGNQLCFFFGPKINCLYFFFFLWYFAILIECTVYACIQAFCQLFFCISFFLHFVSFYVKKIFKMFYFLDSGLSFGVWTDGQVSQSKGLRETVFFTGHVDEFLLRFIHFKRLRTHLMT